MAAGGFEKEKNFLNFILYLYEEEVFMSFNPTHAFMQIFCYYNEQTFDVFKNLLEEFSSNMEDFGLLADGWEKFYVREASALHYADQYNKCWECISLNRNVIDLANNLII